MRIGSAVLLFVTLFGALLPTQTVRADLIAYWHFNGLINNTDNGNLYGSNQGSGAIFLDGFASSGKSADTGSAINAIAPDPAGQALELLDSANNGASLVFFVDMSGYVDPILTFAEQRNEFGFDSIQASWSIDGVAFNDFGAPFAATSGSYAGRTIDFSSQNSLDGAATAFIKFTFNGATSASGEYRIDNPQINATALTSIPEPSFGVASCAVVSLLMGLGLRRRTRIAIVAPV